jgi:hypothetical protein
MRTAMHPQLVLDNVAAQRGGTQLRAALPVAAGKLDGVVGSSAFALYGVQKVAIV